MQFVGTALIGIMACFTGYFLPIYMGLPLSPPSLSRRVRLLDMRALVWAPIDHMALSWTLSSSTPVPPGPEDHILTNMSWSSVST